MALPTISNNSPTAGSIAWTGFSIAYNGVQYTVAASNTSESFVIWLYNNGTPTISKTSVFPSGLTADDQILFLNKGGVGALVPMTDVLDGSLVVPGSIIANSIAANTIQSYHVNANAINALHIQSNVITATEIAANAVTGDELAFNSVTTEHLGVGSVGNSLVVNGSFEEAYNGVPTGWWGDAGGTAGTMVAVTGISTSGTNAVRLALPAITDKIYLKQLASKFIPVTSISGRSWYISAKLGGSVATTDGLYIRAIWYDAAKAYITWSNITAEDNSVVSDKAITTSFAVYEGQVTPPSTARYMSVEISVQLPNVPVNVYIDEVMAREVVVSAIIGDGQISTPKVAANAIVANHIASNVIQANHIVGNSITTDKLLITDLSNAIENPDFEGDVIGAVPKGWGVSGDTVKVIAGGANGSGQAVAIYANVSGNADFDATAYIPVKPGDQLYVEYDYKFLNTAGTGGFTVGFRTYGPAKVAISTGYPGGQITARPTVWTNNGGQIYTVPAGVYYVKPWVTFRTNAEATNQVHVDNIVVRRMHGGELIVDGAVTTNHMAANSINANRLIANTITANQLGANAVTATHIKVNALDGKTITGSTVQTAASGARVVLNSSGLNGYDANNINYLTADSSGLSVTGVLTAEGTGYSGNVSNSFPVNMVVGGSSGHFGITTEQLPPPTPLAGPAVPGIALQPTSIPMYDIAAMYAIDGVTMRLQSGIRSADVTVNNYTASALILWDDSAAFTKPLIAPGATLSANTSVTGKLTVSANAAITGTTTMTGNATVSNKLTVSNVLAVTNAITLGGVDMPLTDISYYESTGSKANFDTVSQGIGTPTYLSGSSTVNLGTSGAGQITVTDAGIYTITASLNLYSDSARTSLKAATGRSFIDIADSTGAAYSRTSLPVGEDQTTGTHAGIKLSASSVLKFNIIQTSGGTAYYKVRIWLTRIG